MEILMEISGLKKAFGGISALDSLDFSLPREKICGVMGPNGSGKTVLFNLISGYLKPDSGSIFFGNNQLDLTHLSNHERYKLGIRRTYQHINLFSSLSVIGNVMVGMGPTSILKTLKECIFLKSRRLYEKNIEKKAYKALEFFSGRLLPRAKDPCLSLSYANRRRLELARAIVDGAVLVMLDEPTAGMNPSETYELQKIIYHLKEQGVTFIIIEHKLFFLEDLADRILVLSEGKKIAEGTVPEIREDPKVKSAYLGNDNAT